MGGYNSALEAAVREAMRQQGIPRGAEVMLTGFSLGGITAADLAADPTFASTYNVRAVLTGGSPVARFDIPDHTQVLSLEHTDDTVPHVDGMSNPDRANWTTYTGETPEAIQPGGKSEAKPHNAFNYSETAAHVQASGNPSVDRFMETANPFLQGQQTSTDYEAVRSSYYKNHEEGK
jgi:dienelactone hydrolase